MHVTEATEAERVYVLCLNMVLNQHLGRWAVIRIMSCLVLGHRFQGVFSDEAWTGSKDELVDRVAFAVGAVSKVR